MIYGIQTNYSSYVASLDAAWLPVASESIPWLVSSPSVM